MNSRKIHYLIVIVVFFLTFKSARAQDDKFDEERGFKKENLFTGGSVSFGLSNNSFQVGGSPSFGYSIARWIDAGVTVNYNYASYKYVNIVDPNDKLHSSTYGGGAFTRLYPVNFAFAQIQFEHNFIDQRLIPGDGSASVKSKEEANSLLLGVGYATGRYPNTGQPFFYLSLLFDVLGNEFSPYSQIGGGIVPILRGGIQVPLFHGKRGIR